ncbi:MAG TPA: acetate--CoA ligase family protein [Syntrophales bacterium]|nr:acetate--CoA ligase family protein [Syntrophales bacterium]
MQNFFNPSSVALIGVPRHTGDGSFNNAEVLLRYGYKGKIFPINPNAKEICGLKVYPSITDVPEAIDLAVVSVARDRVISVIDQCAQAGVTRIIIITQGFADADQEGKEMQEEIVRRAKANGIRIIGPNTMGVVNNFKKFTNSFIETERPEVFSPVSLIAQTGVLQVASQDMAYKHWGKAIDIGNGCDVDVVDALTYFADDPETKVVVIHMEGVKRGRDFLKLVSEVTEKKPVIVFKAGRSQAGAKAALSHTGSMVGEDHVFDAVCKRAGIIRVKSNMDMIDAIHALLLMKEMAGPRIGVASVTGAGGIMAADACEDHGLMLAKLPTGLAEKLSAGLPEWIHVGNPMDLWPISMIGGNYTGTFGTAITDLLRSDEVDGVVAFMPVSTSPLHQNLNLVSTIAESRKNAGNSKPLAMWPYIDAYAFIDEFEKVANVACFNSVERSVQALAFCYLYHQAKNRKTPVQRQFPVEHDKLEALTGKGKKEKILVGDDALLLLNLFGIPVVKSGVARSRRDLEGVASNMAYPLVLKLTGKAFLHKTEWGGVVTGIRGVEDLHRAFDRVLHNASARDRDVKVEAVQIQEQLHGHELLLGLKRDGEFGHVIACGLGGIYTEVFKDVSRAIVPIDGEEANEMLSSLKIAPMLIGLRGEAPIDWNGLVEILERLSFLAQSLPEISELDINPIIAASSGCVAVDARILW